MKTSRFLAPLALLCALTASSLAAAAVPQPKLVRVTLGDRLTIKELLQAGLDVADVRAGEARVLQWPGDEATLARLGAIAQTIDENPGRSAALRTELELRSRPAPAGRKVRSATESDGIFRIQVLPPFGSGSMGGYWTSAEIKMKLDELVASDVNGVVADKIDTLGYSGQGRPIWGLKLGAFHDLPDPRPVAFYNALTHAREPEGMQALFYFVDDLLSRYGVDPFATYLLEQRVIYLVPLVNPDGYKINEDTYATPPNDFGFWRKNARDNNANLTLDGNDGVDLNRNYGFRWGYDGVGSSPNIADETYRGPSAFSEPETQAQRNIVTQLTPRTGFSFHTYSDLLLHPWGYINSTTVHEAAFREWSDELNRENAYMTGISPRVLYPVNGEFNDWCYGDTISKPRSFSWTPEVGDQDGGFWPPPSRIVPLAKENVRACYVIAALAGPWVQEDGVTLIEGAMNAGRATQVAVRARNLGVSGTAGPGLIGTMVPLDPGSHMLRATVGYPTLGTLVSGDSDLPFYLAVDDTVTPGRLMRYELKFVDPAGLFSRDTIVVPVGTPTVLAIEDFSAGLTKWTQGGVPTTWGTVMNDPLHPSRYAADSPTGNYGTNWNTNFRLSTPASLNLSTGVHAYALYEARWDFEADYDAACIEASLNGSVYTRLNATSTTPGSGVTGATSQPPGVPVYAGNRRNWRWEMADLSPFTGGAGTAVRVRFRTQSDGGTGFDGFNFDSFRVVLYDPAAQPVPVAVNDGGAPRILELAPPAPNPVHGFARFAFALPLAGTVHLEILDLQGRRVRTLADGRLEANRYVRGWDLVDDAGHAAPPGIYLARLRGDSGTLTRRFAVLR